MVNYVGFGFLGKLTLKTFVVNCRRVAESKLLFRAERTRERENARLGSGEAVKAFVQI